jgi:hypothetical protein
VLRWIWWRVTAVGELAAIVTSSLLAPLLLATVAEEGARLLLMAAASTLVVVAAAFFGRPEAPSRLREFYRQVRPPGFWGPVAAAEGDDPAAVALRLWRGLGLSFGGALAVFCALVGVGSLLFGASPPAWFPWRWPWIVALLAATAVLAVALRRLERRTFGAEEPGPEGEPA